MIIRALMNVIGFYWNLEWRRSIGIEPIYDSVSAARAGLKSGAPTSDASISVNNNSDLQFGFFHNPFCLHFCLHSESIYPYKRLETALPVSRVSSALRCEYRSVDAADLWPR